VIGFDLSRNPDGTFTTQVHANLGPAVSISNTGAITAQVPGAGPTLTLNPGGGIEAGLHLGPVSATRYVGRIPTGNDLYYRIWSSAGPNGGEILNAIYGPP
jgi:hypothetical protein